MSKIHFESKSQPSGINLYIPEHADPLSGERKSIILTFRKPADPADADPP